MQEVQSDHFLDFWSPELQKAGYVAIYKKKTAEIYTDNKYAIDGCATFFRRDRFQLVKKWVRMDAGGAACGVGLAWGWGGEVRACVCEWGCEGA